MRLQMIEVVYKELHGLTRGENSAHMHKLRFQAWNKLKAPRISQLASLYVSDPYPMRL